MKTPTLSPTLTKSLAKLIRNYFTFVEPGLGMTGLCMTRTWPGFVMTNKKDMWTVVPVIYVDFSSQFFVSACAISFWKALFRKRARLTVFNACTRAWQFLSNRARLTTVSRMLKLFHRTMPACQKIFRDFACIRISDICRPQDQVCHNDV